MIRIEFINILIIDNNLGLDHSAGLKALDIPTVANNNSFDCTFLVSKS